MGEMGILIQWLVIGGAVIIFIGWAVARARRRLSLPEVVRS